MRARAPARLSRPTGTALLAALIAAALALRPQLVGMGPLLPDIQDDLGVSHTAGGLITTIPVLCMGLFAPVAAALAGRWGLRAVMGTCLAATALFGLVRAAAPDAGSLLTLTLPIGIGMAVAGALLPMAVKSRFAHRPVLASGVCTTGLNLGAAFSSALAVPTAEAFRGWRGALAVVSAATIVLCFTWLWLSRGAWAERSSARRPPMPIRRPVVWLIVCVFALNSVVYYGLVAWIADAYQERGWSPDAAGTLLAVMSTAALPGGLLVASVADRAGSRRLWLAGASGGLAIATFGFATVPGAALAWAALAGAAVGALFPLCLALCLDVARDPAETAAAASLMFLAGYPLAAAAAPGLGLTRDLTGSFTGALWIIAAAALLQLAACSQLTRERVQAR